MSKPRKIDQALENHYQLKGIEAAPLCDDLTFLRRITLDLTGRIPTLSEITRFEKNPNCSQKIAELLLSPDYAKHWSDLWTAMLNGYSNAFKTDREALRLWLEKAFTENTPYDQIVTQLVTATGSATQNGAVNFIARYPSEVSVKVSRLFLGIRLDCARCHDHPFDRWKEKDFEQMKRFFDSIERRQTGNGPVTIRNKVSGQGTEKPVFLSGATTRTSLWRDELALFMTHTNAFAKNYANRLWYQLIGRGIVHSPDNFNAENPPAVPALLDALAVRARELEWDIRKLTFEICDSNAYRRSSSASEAAGEELKTFAVRTIKPMTPEQWYDSLTTIYDSELPMSRLEFLRRTIGPQLDEDFSETWLYRETVQQQMQQLALNLLPPAADIETVYLKILGRRPTKADLKICKEHSLDDVTFALINSSEFYFNH